MEGDVVTVGPSGWVFWLGPSMFVKAAGVTRLVWATSEHGAAMASGQTRRRRRRMRPRGSTGDVGQAERGEVLPDPRDRPRTGHRLESVGAGVPGIKSCAIAGRQRLGRPVAAAGDTPHRPARRAFDPRAACGDDAWAFMYHTDCIRAAAVVLIGAALGAQEAASRPGAPPPLRRIAARVIGSRPAPAFTMPSDRPDPDDLCFAAFGDQGTAGAGQRKVAAALERWAPLGPIDLVLLLGDNFYPLP